MTVEQNLYNQLNRYIKNYPSCNNPICNFCLWGRWRELGKFAKIVSMELGEYYDKYDGEERYLLSQPTRKKVVTYALKYLKEKGCVD